MRRITAILLLAGTVALADREATVLVRPDAVIGPVNRLVFGNNQLAYPGREEYSQRGSGIWDPAARRPVPEYVALSKQAGISIHRWPGGCIAHNYNWKLTVGPLAERPNMPFGLPEFMAFCEATDAVAVLTVSVTGGGTCRSYAARAVPCTDWLGLFSTGSTGRPGRESQVGLYVGCLPDVFLSNSPIFLSKSAQFRSLCSSIGQEQTSVPKQGLTPSDGNHRRNRG